MYKKFYGFSEKPFNTTPDSKFFFPSPKHAEALNSLVYAINERRGFVVITGEIGAGKTTVTRTLLNKLDINTKVAMITNSHLTQKELIAQILEELEIDYKPGAKQKLLSQLNTHLIRQLANDMNVVIIIDEAQNLTPKVLEEVRMLSNLETEKEKLVQLILVGQPQLKVKLNNPKLEQFKQRIAVYYHLTPLSRQETHQYIMHRLKLVTSSLVNIFTPEAMDMLYSFSGGVPRIINLLCDSALLSGYIYDTREITEKIVSEVIKERDFNQAGADDQPELKIQPADGCLISCCPECKQYTSCEIKWIRGTKSQKQQCCPNCQSYTHCVIAATKVNPVSKDEAFIPPFL